MSRDRGNVRERYFYIRSMCLDPPFEKTVFLMFFKWQMYGWLLFEFCMAARQTDIYSVGELLANLEDMQTWEVEQNKETCLNEQRPR